MRENIKKAALEYHRFPTPGKIAIRPTKPLDTQRDLALAYSPGVAAACEEIEKNPDAALDYTSRGNLVAVVTNGTAVLGLGAIGPLAAKPVMEGKAVLFKKFANIDSIDIEIDQLDVDKFVDTVAALEPSFGGINLEDIKAPECFEIERRLRDRMKIPVFHDDQHGTAIIVTAAIVNWIHHAGRKIDAIRLVTSGAGAAAIACLNLLMRAGLKRENIIITDRKGVVYEGRSEYMDPQKAAFASKTNARTLAEAIDGADVFLGLSGPGVLKKDMVAKMADAPLIMALANPTPEIMPDEARAGKPDAVICTGRSDFPNQVNNVLCFPFIFRGALDVGATAITEEMKLACVHAIANLARREATAEVFAVYGDEHLQFGPDYLIPKPFDPRLIVEVPVAVARAAMESGVATRPIMDLEGYRDHLHEHFYRTQLVMRPIFARAKSTPQRIVYCEGEEDRVLHAVQVLLDDGLARPVIIGRPKVVETRLKRLRLRMRPNKDFDLIDPEDDPRFREYWMAYHALMERNGVTPAMARTEIRINPTVIGALMLRKNEADALICGTVGSFHKHMKDINDVIGLRPGVETAAAMNALILPRDAIFICDTHINPDPGMEQIVEMTLLAAEEVRRFGLTPRVALLSHSSFGTHDCPSARKMRLACAEIRRRAPELEIDGEMHADAALSEDIRQLIMPNSTLTGSANLLIMPTVESANIAFNMLKILGDGIGIGPILLGGARPAHILTPSTTTRGIVNVSALAAVQSQIAHTAPGP